MNLEGKRILLVEDEMIIGFALEDMLAGEGSEPRLTSCRSDAETALAEARFDMAIIDVNLNGEASYPLADALIAADLPFIFATGYGNVTHPDRFAEVPTVSKPYDLPGIVDALEKAVAG